MKSAIVVDSTTVLPDNLVPEVPIFVLPVRVYIDGKEYQDREDISLQDIKTAIEENRLLETSLPLPSRAEELITKLSKEYDQVYVLSLSSKLSGTYNLLYTLAENKENVKVFDTKTVSLQNSYIIQRMVKDIKCGIIIEEDDIIRYKDESLMLVSVLSTDRIIKSGRLSGAVKNLLRILKIKPLLTVDRHGELKVISNSLSIKKIVEKAKEEIIEFIDGEEKKNFVLYASVGEDSLKEHVYEISSFLGIEPVFLDVSSAIALHVGFETFGLVIGRASFEKCGEKE